MIVVAEDVVGSGWVAWVLPMSPLTSEVTLTNPGELISISPAVEALRYLRTSTWHCHGMSSENYQQDMGKTHATQPMLELV